MLMLFVRYRQIHVTALIILGVYQTQLRQILKSIYFYVIALSLCDSVWLMDIPDLCRSAQSFARVASNFNSLLSRSSHRTNC